MALILFAVFSVLSVVGLASATPLTAAGFLAWGLLLLALTRALAAHFRRVGGVPSPWLRGPLAVQVRVLGLHTCQSAHRPRRAAPRVVLARPWA